LLHFAAAAVACCSGLVCPAASPTNARGFAQINGVGGFVKSLHQSDAEAIGAPASGKPLLLEMLDKPEAVAVPDTYGVSLAFAALSDTIKSMSSLLPAR